LPIFKDEKELVQSTSPEMATLVFFLHIHMHLWRQSPQILAMESETINATRILSTSMAVPMTWDPYTAVFSVSCSFLAVWIWQEGIGAAISLNARICLLVVFFTI
jgi:hypothetical protein